MKKAFRVFLIILGVIMLLLITLPVLFKSKIEETVKTKVNQEIHASVDWSRFSVSFFRGFPDLSVNLHRVSVVGMEPFEGDTLAGLKRFEIRVNPFSALKKEIQVKSILLDQPLINGKVLEEGSVNWDIAQSDPADQPEPASAEESGSSMTIALQKFAIHEGRIYYDDQTTGTNASMEGFNLELSGDFSLDLTQLDLQLTIDRINVKQGGVKYLKDGSLGLNLLAEANMVENSYTLKESELRLNGLVLGTEGVIYLLDEGAIDMDLRFFTQETTFQTLLSLVPAIYMKDFEQIKTSGLLKLEGSVKGLMKDTLMPDVKLALQVSDGYFAYPDLPKDVSDVQINMVVDYKGTDVDATIVELERFHLMLGGNPLDVSLKVDHPISDMHIAGEAVGVINFATLRDVVPIEDINLEGLLEADLRWDTRMSYIEQEQFDKVDMDGTLLIEQVQIESTEFPVPVQISKMQMDFNPRYVELVTLDLILGSSDLHMDGELANFIPYLFDDQTVVGSLNVISQLLDANELMPESVSDELTHAEEEQMGKVQVKIPENIQFAMTVQMDKVIYDQIEVEQIHGLLKVSEGIAYLDNLTLSVIQGVVSTTGKVDTRGELAQTDVLIDIRGIDIQEAYMNFVTVERLAPMAKYCRGSANMTVQYKSLLDASFAPVYESIDASGKMFTNGLRIHDLSSFGRLSEMLNNDTFKEMAPDEVEASFIVKDGRITFQPFTMDFEGSTIVASGSHGIDNTLDYRLDMNIAKSDLGKGANDMLKGLSLLAAGAGIRIPESDYVKVLAKIKGTFDKPKVTTDLTGNLKTSGETVVKAVETKVMEEVEKVEEKAREEVSDQADNIISEAEAEAKRLIEEARKAGEALVKEAEVQGENLIEEAGDNSFRQMAAKRAAQELKRQAEKQSENMIREAETKAEELIEQARVEAEKI